MILKVSSMSHPCELESGRFQGKSLLNLLGRPENLSF